MHPPYPPPPSQYLMISRSNPGTLTLGGVFGGKPVSKSSSAVTPVSSPSEADQVKARVLLALKAKKSKGSNAQIERKQKQDAGEHTTRQNGPVLGSDTETKHAETNKVCTYYRVCGYGWVCVLALP